MKPLTVMDRKLLIYLLKQGQEQNSYQSCDDVDLVEDCGILRNDVAAVKRAIQEAIDPEDEDEVDVTSPLSGEGDLYRYFLTLLQGETS